MTPDEATHAFAQEVAAEGGQVRLDRAALLVAAHAHPEMDLESEVARLEEIAAGVSDPTLDGVRRHLFRDLKFVGNRRNYYDPENSFLDSVMRRRRGIPISLAVVTLEVARRQFVPLRGIGMPGHFLVGDRVDPGLFIDVFDHGAPLRVEDCARIHARLQGAGVPFDPEQMLVEVSPIGILDRMLANLQAIYGRGADRRSLGWVLELRSRLPGATPEVRVAHAEVLAGVGRFKRAADALEGAALALDDVDSRGAEDARRRAGLMRARLN